MSEQTTKPKAAAAIIRDLMRGRLQAAKSAQTAWQRDEALLRQALDRLEAVVERFDPYIRDNECRPMENARSTITALRERLGVKA